MERRGMMGILACALILLMAAGPLFAAELSGKVYRGGTPVANLGVAVEDKGIETRTDGKGEYRFDLPPGNYTLVIRGQRFSVTVSPGGSRQDIRL